MRKIPRKIFNLVFFIFIFSHLSAQPQKQQLMNPGQYLFSEFSKGGVAMKGGKDLNLILNYNIVTGKMVFMQKGDIYDMTNYSGVDTVYISGHRFIPVGEVFYEVVIEGKFPLYIQHSGKVQSPPKPAAYGGTSEVSSASYINNISLGNDVYRLKNDPEVRIKADKTYYTLMGGEWVIIRSMKNLAKLAGLETDAFLKYIKEKNLKFENPADVIAAAEYCNR